MEDDILQAAIIAVTAFFRFQKSALIIKFQQYLLMLDNFDMFHTCCRGGGKIGKKAVQQNYASVLAELTLQLGSCHGLASHGQHDPLR